MRWWLNSIRLTTPLDTCFYTTFEGTWPHEILSQVPMVCLPMSLKEPSPFHGRGPWPHEWGEATATYIWIGCVWEITNWNSTLHDCYRSFKMTLWNIPQNYITLLTGMGPHNIIIECCEFSLNLDLQAQLFEHLTVIFRGPTKLKLNVK